jgi:hypothetical protein
MSKPQPTPQERAVAESAIIAPTTSLRGTDGTAEDDPEKSMDLSAPHPRMAGSNLPIHSELIQNGWKLVRHCPAGDKWHPADDRLRGTSK